MRKLRVVVSLITDDNDYQRQQATAAKDFAARLGLELHTLFAQNDAIHQSQQLLDVIQTRGRRVDGILVEPVGGTAFPKIAQAAVASGIAWIVLNCQADYLAKLRSGIVVPAFAVSADNLEIGRIQGRQLRAVLPHGGSVLYVQGPANSSVTRQRRTGMFETKPENVKVKALKSMNWTEDAGFHAVDSWLRVSAGPLEKIDAVQAQNDCLVVGARRAIERHYQSRSNARCKLLYLGVDGLPRGGRAWVRHGTLMATVLVPTATSHALSAFVAMMQGGMPPPSRMLMAPESFPRLDELQTKFETCRY